MTNQTQQGVMLQPYKKLVDYVKNNPQKGLIISHIDVEKIMGIPYKKNCNCNNSMYNYNVTKANKILTTLSLRLEPIKGYGYRIIKDNEYVYSMQKAYNAGIKNIQKAKFIADNTNVNNLTHNELSIFNKTHNKIQKALKIL